MGGVVQVSLSIAMGSASEKALVHEPSRKPREPNRLYHPYAGRRVAGWLYSYK